MAITLINRKVGIHEPIITPAASNLLFSTNFASSVALGATSTWSFSTTARGFLTGTDGQTGQVMPVNNGTNQGLMNLRYADVLAIVNGVSLTSGNIDTYAAAAIQDTTGPDGTTEKELFLNLKASTGDGDYKAQLDLELFRQDGTNITYADLTHLYTSYYFKRPAALLSGMVTNSSAVLLDYKSNGPSMGGGGDFRLIQHLYKRADGLMYVRTQADKNANGAITTSPYDILTWTGSDKYWDERDNTVSVPMDQWVKFEMYVYRHQSKGIVLSAINDQIVCNHVGRTLGEFGAQWGRLFPFLMYSSIGACSGSACRFRFRDYVPAGSVLQIPAAEHIYKHAA